MKKRFTEEKIIGFIKEAEAGLAVDALCRKHGIGSSTFYKWKPEFDGMDVSHAETILSR
ncbi:transposase [Pusillimonas sp. ANT_WB101]|nr:transposase [Pusillimonas sp. ANT_WB101]